MSLKDLIPCKGCEEREVGCHGSCLRYLAWKKLNDDIRKKQRQEFIVKDAIAESRRRMKRKRPPIKELINRGTLKK